jgi:hypothetical protein
MSAKIKYTDEPLGEVQVAPDFLPSPAELAFREEGMNLTPCTSPAASAAVAAPHDRAAVHASPSPSDRAMFVFTCATPGRREQAFHHQLGECGRSGATMRSM